jgi:hypothetical protein
MFKIPYIPIGAAQKYSGIEDGLRHPAILYTRGLELYNPQLVRRKEKERSAEA